jgi:shikimate dehydrogenase
LAALRHGAGLDDLSSGRSVVVGAGGAARAAVLALAGAGAAEVVVVNRSPQRAATAAALAGDRGRVGTADDARDALLVVQATPAGMRDTPTEHESPLVPAELLGPGQVAVDLVYHPLRTPWVTEATDRGAVGLGGLGMLVHQAAEQFTAWTGGLEAPVEAMWRAASAATG